MKSLVITSKGLEKITSSEIKELINKDSTFEESVVFFESTMKENQKLSYYGQSFFKVLKYISSIDVDKNIFENIIKKIEHIKVGSTFRLKCKRIGEHEFSSVEVETECSGPILKNNDTKVDLKKPETIIYIYIYNNRCHIGIDISIADLSKRDYKIFIHPASLKATYAYALVKFSKYTKDKILLDPFCGSGTILIETALKFSGLSQNHYTKNKFNFKCDDDKKKKIKLKIYGYDQLLKHIIAARKNAKIAGVEDLIEFSKCDVAWLDSKFEEKSVDLIVTDPPRLSKHNQKNYPKLIQDFFKISLDILKEKGTVTLITNKKSLEVMENNCNGFILHEIIESENKNILVKFIKN